MATSKGPSLVDEIKGKKEQEQADAIAAARAKRTRRLIILGISVALVAAAGVAAKISYDRYRATSSLAEAREHLHELAGHELDAADEALDRALELAPTSPEGLATRALVGAHRAFFHGGDVEAAKQAVDAAESGGADPFEVAISRALIAFTEGDSATVESLLAELPPAPGGSEVAHHPDWLQALLILAKPTNRATTDQAIASAEKAVDAAPEWLFYRRTRDALRFATGDDEKVEAEVQAARKEHPQDLGLAVDETLYLSLRGDKSTAVVLTANKLLETTDALLEFDVARVHLARAMAKLHEGDRKAAVDDFLEAWLRAAPWDFRTRQGVMEGLRWLDESKAGRKLIKSVKNEDEARMYAAALDIADMKLIEALSSLSQLPQDLPEVAQLQALALVEQRRFNEAQPWIERALAFYPGRPDLEVARLRVLAGTGKIDGVVAQLEALSSAHKQTPRVWTALGEAHLAAEDQASALAAFRKAVENEPHAAEAQLQLAQAVEGNFHRNKAKRDEKTELLEAAAKADPEAIRYRRALADHLTFIGYDVHAIEVLRELAKDPAVDADSLLLLVEFELSTAHGLTDALEAEVVSMLDKAEKLGANATDLARERARLDVARDKPESIEAARAALEPLVSKHQDDAKLRLVYIDALLAANDPDTAAREARMGIRKVGEAKAGLFYVAWANAEAKNAKTRGAARIARDGWKKVSEESDRPALDMLAAASRAMELYMRLEQDDIARRTGRELTMKLPLHPDAWALRAELELDSRMQESGCQTAAKGVELELKTHMVHAAMSRCLASLGKTAEAKAELQKAIELAQSTADLPKYEKRMKAL